MTMFRGYLFAEGTYTALEFYIQLSSCNSNPQGDSKIVRIT